MAAIDADPAVMEHFPAVKTYKETEEFVIRMQSQFAEKRYCYFAVDILATRSFIGFTGISKQTFDAMFTPCIDIGWRLAKDAWGKGYATEGATRCLQYAFEDLGMRQIYAIAPKVNERSIHVMQKAGMEKAADFMHPLITDERLKECVLYCYKVKDPFY